MNTLMFVSSIHDRVQPFARLLATIAIATMLLAFAGSSITRAQETNDQSEDIRQTAAELATVRARVIRENPEAAAIHKRILRLYSELDRELGKHPEIQRLRHRLDKLRPKPSTPSLPDAPATPTPGDPKP
ncbi:MAG: hypothetical protein ACOC0L_02360 [bacterium]